MEIPVNLTLMAARTQVGSVELGAHSGPLHLIVFSDWRIQDISLLVEEISQFPTKPDLILYGGDDIPRFREAGNNLFEDLARCSRYGICAVIGNDDSPSVRTLISGNTVFNVHKTPVTLGEYTFIGLEAAPPADGFMVGFCYSEKEIERHLAFQKRVAKKNRIIILSHAPPFGALDKALRFSRDGRPRSIGSKALAQFVRNNKTVALVVCGHVHRYGGKHERLGRSLVVNVASHDRLGNVGRFALLTLGLKNDVKVEWREIVEVSCIAGIKERSTERLRAAGIRTVQEFAGADISALAKILSHPPPRPIEMLKARALSLAGNKPILFRSLALPPSPELFLDIETDSQGGLKLVWLIGLCLGRNGPYKSFLQSHLATNGVPL